MRILKVTLLKYPKRILVGLAEFMLFLPIQETCSAVAGVRPPTTVRASYCYPCINLTIYGMEKGILATRDKQGATSGAAGKPKTAAASSYGMDCKAGLVMLSSPGDRTKMTRWHRLRPFSPAPAACAERARQALPASQEPVRPHQTSHNVAMKHTKHQRCEATSV